VCALVRSWGDPKTAAVLGLCVGSGRQTSPARDPLRPHTIERKLQRIKQVESATMQAVTLTRSARVQAAPARTSRRTAVRVRAAADPYLAVSRYCDFGGRVAQAAGRMRLQQAMSGPRQQIRPSRQRGSGELRGWEGSWTTLRVDWRVMSGPQTAFGTAAARHCARQAQQ
jgi:hypothetical protein